MINHLLDGSALRAFAAMGVDLACGAGARSLGVPEAAWLAATN